jgi:hypothetical protein
MDKWLVRLGYALRRHGPAGFIGLAGYNIVYYFLRRRRSTNGLAQAVSFDEKYGTDTDGIREIGSLDAVDLPAARYAVRYDPSSPERVEAQIENLQIEYVHFTFIDFGSGKGRVLLIAAGFPFKEVVGIEFSRELHAVALQNIARLPPDVTRAGTVHSIHGDAASFEPPRSDLVCYFYNPFGAPIMEAVVGRLVGHHERYGYRVIVIYVDPRHPEIFEKTGKFVILDKAPNALILTTHAEVAAGSTVAF